MMDTLGWMGPVWILFGVVLYLGAWQKYANGNRDEMLLGLLCGTGFLLLGTGVLVGFNAFLVFSIVFLIFLGTYFSLKVQLKKSSPNWWKWYKDQP